MEIYMNGEKCELEGPQTAIEFARANKLTEPNHAIGLLVNGQPHDLSYTLKPDDNIEFLSFEDPRGKHIFWHSSAHVLAQAVMRLFPEAKPTIGPAIDEGFYYDFADLKISEDDFSKIEKEMKKIIKENFKPERKEFSSKSEALELFGSNRYKRELIEDLPDDATISAYTQGEFCDLCRGPHLSNLGKIKAIKLLKTSGAYWRADSTNAMLTRIYGISFPSSEELKAYLFRLAEAKRRDHRILGQKLNLFSFKEEAPGIPFIHPKGMLFWNRLIDFWRSLHSKGGYQEIKTPSMMSQELWETSGHWAHYSEHMYVTEVEERKFAIKPMNCPGCMLYYKSFIHSYRDFPLRVSEIGHVHRHEFSGALSGLFRVRSFHQDDAHIFMTKEQITQEILEVFKITDALYSAFDLKYRVELSTRPEEGSIGTDADWEETTKALQDALEASGVPYKLNPGDGAFYGPKIDFHIQDALGRSWQCGTIQLDMSLPERFDLEYTSSEGTKKRPIMIHRALFGSIERFMGILIEHYAGRFPLWLSPSPVRILTVSDRHVEYAEHVKRAIEECGFECEIDATSETIGKKVRLAQMNQVNYMLTLGDKECDNHTLSVRTRTGSVVSDEKTETFLEKIATERREKSPESPYTQKSHEDHCHQQFQGRHR